MDWFVRLTRAMDYIEENLEEDIDWVAVGRKATMSAGQFARMFTLMSGVPLSEYVRLRRLTKAALDLQQRGDKVLDVALRYGYASPTAFQRAFVQFHGVTPSLARQPGVRLKAYPRMTFHISVQGGVALQYRIEEKPAFRAAGYGEWVSMLNGENFTRIPQMWAELSKERCAQMEQGYADGPYPGMFGVMWMGEDPNKLFYAIAVSTEKTVAEDGLQIIEIPTQTYAVFETPMASLQDVTRRIYAEWMPASGYEHAAGPEMEYYPVADMSDPAKYICEIWVPVVKA